MQSLTEHFLTALDATMRQIVAAVPLDDAPDFSTMLRYPLGWVDENNHPYSQASGKQIRPLLLLLCAQAVGGNWQLALPAAASVEFLHNFSLIHDDIEDDSPTRRGRLTVWKIWGRASAINAGDALFALSYSALQQLGTSPEITLKVWQIFNRTVLELTRGQHLDMRFEHVEVVTVDEYLSMIRGKSAALVSASAEIGALIGCGDPTLSGHFAEYGRSLGVAFQIRDDILGIWGDPERTGKSAATDILSRKKTLPVLYGLSKSERLVEIYHRDPFGDEQVAEAVALLNDAHALEYAQECEIHLLPARDSVARTRQPAGRCRKRLVLPHRVAVPAAGVTQTNSRKTTLLSSRPASVSLTRVSSTLSNPCPAYLRITSP